MDTAKLAVAEARRELLREADKAVAAAVEETNQLIEDRIKCQVDRISTNLIKETVQARLKAAFNAAGV